MSKSFSRQTSTRKNFLDKLHNFFSTIEKICVNLTELDHDGDEKPVDGEVELLPFIGLSVMIMLMMMTTTIMTMIMTIMMMILMIIMMVSMVIMMKSEMWKRRLSFLHLSAACVSLRSLWLL